LQPGGKDESHIKVYLSLQTVFSFYSCQTRYPVPTTLRYYGNSDKNDSHNVLQALVFWTDNIKMANGNKPKPEIGSLAKDVVFPAGPQDTISSVCWSPAYSHVAATSWDGKVYIYDVAQPSNIRGLTTISNPTNAPFLDCDFNKVSPAST